IDVLFNYEIIEFNGKPATFATIKDITQQKKAEKELKESEQFLQKSLDSLSSNIAVLDEKGFIIAVNKRWKEFGIKNGLLEKNFCVGINYIQLCENAKGDYAEDGILVAKEIRSLLQGEKEEFHFEYPCHSPLEKRWFIAHFTSFEQNGKPRVIVAHENITERKIAEQKIIEAKEKAEEANRLKSNFLLNMSHELRTPLVGILGFAEILLSELENEDHKNMVETILTSGQRLLETLSLILNLSKVESGREEINLSEFDVNTICLEVANLFTAQATKKNLSLNIDFRYKELFIKSDQRLLRDVLNNLVNNAIKFTNEGGIIISTYITNYNDKNYIAIEVSDTGIGIPEDKIDLIFEEFRQVSEGMNRSFEGTGLGLALTKKVVQLLGGEIKVESKVGFGSKFIVYLPSEYNLHTLTLQNKLLVNQEKHELKNEVFPDKKILAVEDDWVSRKFLEIVLKDYCVVEFANSAVEALEKVKSNFYDAILMDINLGRGQDGITTTQLIRQIPDYKNTPIAAITAFATQQDKEEFLSKGCTHYLSKPYTKIALLKLVDEMLSIQK
ncbi:MAG: ATP-binding protein, partial [Ignavibacterium sp.]